MVGGNLAEVMHVIGVLKVQSQIAYDELLLSLSGVSERQSWGMLPQHGKDYLHSDGSIHGVVLHVATAKRMYGSIGFRNTEIRWRDCAEQVEAFEPSWESALRYLESSHSYWMESWAAIEDTDLEKPTPHFSGRVLPAWRVIQTMINHDIYHAGQIAVLRYGVAESDSPPLSVAADIREHCSSLPSW